MMKREFMVAGALGLSLFAVSLGAAETAPETAQTTPNAPAQAAPAQTQFVEEQQSFTIVAIPCPAPGKACAEKCPEKAECKDKDKCPEKPECEDKAAACMLKGKCPVAGAGCPAPADYSDDDYTLAYELLELTGTPENLDEANSFVIAAQMQQTPALKPAHTAFKDFFARHCSYEAMKRDLARIHLETFTRDELKKLIDFFKTPVGKKYARNQNDMLKHCLELREKRIHANLPELQQNVQNAMAAGAPPADGQNAQAQNQN